MSQSKSWVEIFLMPLVVAGVGIVGTSLVTDQQAENAALARKTELEKTQEIADADRQIKILEIFSQKITSSSEQERILALKLLTALDGDLASKLAVAVSQSADSESAVYTAAQNIVEQSKLAGHSFAVVQSTKDFDLALKSAAALDSLELPYAPKIYLSDNGFFAVTLGGYLSLAEAKSRSNFAVEQGIAADAYVRNSMSWGENLYTP